MLYLDIFGLEIKKKLLSYLKSAPLNLSNCKVSRNNAKMPEFGTKMPYLGIFGQEFSKNYCHSDHTFMTSNKNVQFLQPPFPFCCLSEWVRIGQDPPTPGRRNLGYQPTPIPFGIHAKNWNVEEKTKMLSKA